MNLGNIEAVARAICEDGIRTMYLDPADLARAVDRYWHCVAAELEGGEGVEAYRDWRARHPEYVVPGAAR
jgi:hypothetical protein